MGLIREYTEEDCQKIQAELRESELIAADEYVEKVTDGDYWDMMGMSQTRGHWYFTNKQIIFIGGLMGGEVVHIPVDRIKSVKKYNIRFIIPTGIKVVAENDKGKDKTYRLSVMKRENWIDYITKSAKLTA